MSEPWPDDNLQLFIPAFTASGIPAVADEAWISYISGTLSDVSHYVREAKQGKENARHNMRRNLFERPIPI
jgi:hypothetical protein